MPDFIGVTCKPLDWKHALLLFDRIAYPCASGYLSSHERYPEQAELLADGRSVSQVGAEIQFLLDADVVYEPWGPYLSLSPDFPKEKEWSDLMGAAFRAAEQLSNETKAMKSGIGVPEAYAARTREYFDSIARANAYQMNVLNSDNSVPVVNSVTVPPRLLGGRAETARIVIGQMPIPGDTHSLEDVIAFAKETRHLRLRLRNWMREMSLGNRKGPEIAEELEYLISEYEQAIKLEKMTRNVTSLEALWFPAKGVTEYLSTLAFKLFNVRGQQIELMKVENAKEFPGREVAYIVKARERFAPRS